MNELLPVGSVVLLKGGTQKTIIMGYLQFDKKNQNKIYDYMGVPFPEGYMGRNSAYLFNQDSIEKIFYRGYEDESAAKIMTAVSSVMEKVDKLITDACV